MLQTIVSNYVIVAFRNLNMAIAIQSFEKIMEDVTYNITIVLKYQIPVVWSIVRQNCPLFVTDVCGY